MVHDSREADKTVAANDKEKPNLTKKESEKSNTEKPNLTNKGTEKPNLTNKAAGKTLSLTQKQFLSLMRMGLYSRPENPNHFRQCQWGEVMRMAKDQGVLGIVIDGVTQLQPFLPALANIMIKLFPKLYNIEKKNKKADETAVAFYKMMEEKGFSPHIVKGQVVAREYPHPNHRMCGDIDVWIADGKEAEDAFCWAEKEYDCRWMPGEKETSFDWNNALVELHRRIADMQHKPFDLYLQSLVKKHSLPVAEKAYFVEIENTKIRTTSVYLTLLHLVIHLQYHILAEGIGFRQFCDLALFIRNHSEELMPRKEEIQRDLEGCGVDKMAAAIGWILHKQLAVEQEKIPFRISPQGAEKILEDIWIGGNFGKNRYGYVSNYGFLRRKLTMFPVHFRQFMRYRELLPKEAFVNFLSKFFRAAKGVK